MVVKSQEGNFPSALCKECILHWPLALFLTHFKIQCSICGHNPHQAACLPTPPPAGRCIMVGGYKVAGSRWQSCGQARTPPMAAQLKADTRFFPLLQLFPVFPLKCPVQFSEPLHFLGLEEHTLINHAVFPFACLRDAAERRVSCPLLPTEDSRSEGPHRPVQQSPGLQTAGFRNLYDAQYSSPKYGAYSACSPNCLPTSCLRKEMVNETTKDLEEHLGELHC